MDLQPNKTLVIVNGYPTAGKDSFIDFCNNYIGLEWTYHFKSSVKMSSVEVIKEAAKLLGYTGQKTDNERNFLAELKNLATKHFNHSFNYITQAVKDRSFDIYFVMVREPSEIEKLVEFYKYSDVKVLTLLVRRDKDLLVENDADKNVLEYKYDICIDNKNSLDDLQLLAKEFVDKHIVLKPKIR